MSARAVRAARAAVQLLTIAEAGERLRCSENHVYRLVAAGVLRAIDVAPPSSRKPKTRISEADLAQYVEAQGRGRGDAP